MSAKKKSSKKKRLPLLSLRRFDLRKTVIVAVVLSLAGIIAIVASHAMGPGLDKAAQAKLRAKGITLRGLKSPTPGGPCDAPGLKQVDSARGQIDACTHGPDPVPAGLDINSELNKLDQAATGYHADSALASPSPGQLGFYCVSDGVTGKRVQFIYAYEQGLANRRDALALTMLNTASLMNKTITYDSAASGKAETMRMVQNSQCYPTFQTVMIPKSTVDQYNGGNYSVLWDAIKNAGFTRTNRRYVVFADFAMSAEYANGTFAPVCGTGDIAVNNTSISMATQMSNPMYAFVAAGCWNNQNSPLHELFHTLGAVQLDAPHSSGAYHCIDEHDIMCYADGSMVFNTAYNGRSIVYNCPDATNENHLDCQKNDYFNSNPATSNFLSNHWDIARDSGYFEPL
ncbi:MAG TPA: hypothetical protein VLE72_01605 [Candidatus Saccharimonadales bacterium]|nr:hypothetical protein [Candidatus Saccharimonadales bacterium]